MTRSRWLIVIAVISMAAAVDSSRVWAQSEPPRAPRVVDEDPVPTVGETSAEDEFEELLDGEEEEVDDAEELVPLNAETPSESAPVEEAPVGGTPTGGPSDETPVDGAADPAAGSAPSAADPNLAAPNSAAVNPAVPNPGTVSPTFDRPATPGGIAVPAPAQRARPLNLKPPVKPQQVVTEEQLRAQVERMVQAYRLGDYTKFKLELAELENMRTQAGIANIVLASSALIRHAQSALSSGVFDRAHELSSAAVRLSPDLVAARWTHLNILWATDWTRIRPISGAAVGLVSAQFGSFRNQISALTSILLIVGLAALITIMAFAVMQLFKYVRYPAHDIAARLPAVIGTPQVVFALLLAVITPMAFGWGPVVSTIFALVIIVGYQSATEQAVSRTILGLIVAVPLCLVAVAPLITFHGSLVDDMATAISDAFASQAEQRLFATSSTRRDRDPTSAMILARRKRLRGDLPGADLAYERALEIRPGDPVALNNRGVVQFMLGHHEAAVSLFARGAAVEHVESILNLATVRAEQGAFEEASTLMERANRIAGDLDDYARSPEDGTDASKLLYEAEIDSSALWGHLLEVDRDAWWVVAQSIWSRVGATPLWLVSVLALVALVFSAFIASRRDRLSAACPKCGTPASRNAYGQLCEQCTSVFLTAVAVEPRLRAQKESEVRAYQRRRRLTERLTSVAGLGSFIAGRPILGSATFFLLSIALLVWLFRGGVLVHDWQVVYDASSETLLGTVSLVVAAVLCLNSLRQSFER